MPQRLVVANNSGRTNRRDELGERGFGQWPTARDTESFAVMVLVGEIRCSRIGHRRS